MDQFISMMLILKQNPKITSDVLFQKMREIPQFPSSCTDDVLLSNLYNHTMFNQITDSTSLASNGFITAKNYQSKFIPNDIVRGQPLTKDQKTKLHELHKEYMLQLKTAAKQGIFELNSNGTEKINSIFSDSILDIISFKRKPLSEDSICNKLKVKFKIYSDLIDNETKDCVKTMLDMNFIKLNDDKLYEILELGLDVVEANEIERKQQQQSIK